MVDEGITVVTLIEYVVAVVLSVVEVEATTVTVSAIVDSACVDAAASDVVDSKCVDAAASDVLESKCVDAAASAVVTFAVSDVCSNVVRDAVDSTRECVVISSFVEVSKLLHCPVSKPVACVVTTVSGRGSPQLTPTSSLCVQ